MRLVFSPRALRRLQEIQRYIARDDAAAALRVLVRIRQTAEILCDHPKLGRDWDGRTRAVVVSGLPYRIHCRIDPAEGVVEVITGAY